MVYSLASVSRRDLRSPSFSRYAKGQMPDLPNDEERTVVEVAATSGYDAASRTLAAQSVGVFPFAFSSHAETSPTRIFHPFLLVLLIMSTESSSLVRVYP